MQWHLYGSDDCIMFYYFEGHLFHCEHPCFLAGLWLSLRIIGWVPHYGCWCSNNGHSQHVYITLPTSVSSRYSCILWSAKDVRCVAWSSVGPRVAHCMVCKQVISWWVRKCLISCVPVGRQLILWIRPRWPCKIPVWWDCTRVVCAWAHENWRRDTVFYWDCYHSQGYKVW